MPHAPGFLYALLQASDSCARRLPDVYGTLHQTAPVRSATPPAPASALPLFPRRTKLLAAPVLPVHRSHRRAGRLHASHHPGIISSNAMRALRCHHIHAMQRGQLPLKLVPFLSLSFPAGRSRPHLSQNDTLKCRQTHVPAAARHLSISASSARLRAIQSLLSPSLRSAALRLYIGRSPMHAITPPIISPSVASAPSRCTPLTMFRLTQQPCIRHRRPLLIASRHSPARLAESTERRFPARSIVPGIPPPAPHSLHKNRR